MFSRQERVEIFMSHFQGRHDVFARRWERPNGQSGYAPVYTDRTKTAYQPLTTEWIERHLIGTETLGVYPLLPDNTSQFIVADFDGAGWRDSTLKFLEVASRRDVPIAVERSRSGNGGHAWCFFTELYPAYKSRRFYLALLREAGIIGLIDKNESFDRLFPNQDYHSGKGLGNLIMFPLQGVARKSGNSVFVNPNNDFAPYSDQWQFLHDVPRLTVQEIDNRYTVIAGRTDMEVRGKTHPKSPKLILVVSNAITISKENIPPTLIPYLRELLNMPNVEYFVKERAGLPTFGVERYIATVTSDDDNFYVPRGFLPKLTAWLEERKTPYLIRDKRTKLKSVRFKNAFQLFDFQGKAVEAFASAENGVLVAPAGSGKTIMGLAIIAQKKQPAIILTHRRQIYDQWLERIDSGFNIAKKRVGQICGTKKRVKLPITVAMVETLARLENWGNVPEQFGTVMLDECQHVPARMFRGVISRFKGKYRFGLTATPDRKYGDSKLAAAYLGDIVYTVPKDEVVKNAEKTTKSSERKRDRVIVTTTHIKAPFGNAPRNFPLVAKIISNDSGRNALIATQVTTEAESGKTVLVLTERKEHAEMLQAHLRRNFETVLFSGDLSMSQRKRAIQRIKSGRFKILIATGQIVGEGTDIANLDVLFLAFPVSFHGKLAQYVGRIRREGGTKVVYDYRDVQVPLLEKMWQRRQAFYRKNDFEVEEVDNGGSSQTGLF